MIISPPVRQSSSWVMLYLVLLGHVSSMWNVMAFVPSRRRSYAHAGFAHAKRSFLSQPQQVGQNSFTLKAQQSAESTATELEIGKLVGSGSYGIVHRVCIDGEEFIGKRAWNENDDVLKDAANAKERAERCRYYFNVEQHCFEKLSNFPAKHTPEYKGTYTDRDGNEWMVFELLTSGGRTNEAAKTLADVIEADWSDQHKQQDEHHHLFLLQQEMNLEPDASFGDTLDAAMQSLLDILDYIHSHDIVHRDVKPGNLLCKDHRFVLIDFGSAADMEPISKNFLGQKRFVGIENENRVALSPIYCAPELFVKPECAPLAFDVFSAGLVFCQLLFNYLDERTDAAFHQQVEDAQYDLDTWLSREFSSKVRPSGLEDALAYLGERPGLWRLLGDMLRQNPEQRVTSKEAAKRFREIIKSAKEEIITTTSLDGSFFESVINAMETCEIPPSTTEPRPLHFVATFQRKLSLGLVLSEVDESGDEEFEDEESKQKWLAATANARPGEVFVREIVPYGQADQMEIFDVGDRLQGVGELPLADGGFETVVKMLERQLPRSKFVKLHFDRLSPRPTEPDTEAPPHLVRIVEQGAWSAMGRRKAQEDAFVLHEIHNHKDTPILVAGVFDGHGGVTASQMASELLPSLLSEMDDVSVKSLAEAWDATCNTYRNGCDDELKECLADYDATDGILKANTGSDSMVAGTTASVMAMASHEHVEKMTCLNCGDSRTLVVGESPETKSVVCFATEDHSPSNEAEQLRLLLGREQGLNYAVPQCSLSKWWLSVGDYQYAVSRSLEGSFATSKGIVSDPDLKEVDLSKLLADRQQCCIVLASDGLLEVMDNEFVGKDIIGKRKNGMSAGDAAKALCSLAIEKGTSDNVSVLVVYLE